MKVTVKCSTCAEELGTIEKPEITEIDIEFYRVMVVCSQGHGLENIALEEIAEEE